MKARTVWVAIGAVLVVGSVVVEPAPADLVNPIYFGSSTDAVTGNNEFTGSDGKRRWFVDPGADRYQNEVYERPTIQTYQGVGTDPFATEEYYQNLDIVSGRTGFDNQYLYVSIEMFGQNRSDQAGDHLEGMKYEYGFRFSLDADGRNGYQFRTTFADPLTSNAFSPLKSKANIDTDLDVGGRGGPIHGNPGPSGLNVTKEDNPLEEVGLNGYDTVLINDGVITLAGHANVGETVLFSRIDPDNLNTVELALDYTLLGLTQDDLLAIEYLDLQSIKGDPMDPANYFWNDKYNQSEAGAPYYDPGGFGIDGLGNIYELDTLNGPIPIPAPGAILLGVIGLGLLGTCRRRPET